MIPAVLIVCYNDRNAVTPDSDLLANDPLIQSPVIQFPLLDLCRNIYNIHELIWTQ